MAAFLLGACLGPLGGCRPDLPSNAARAPADGPREESLLVLPDDGGEDVVATFAAARGSIDLEAYWLSDARIVGALLAATARGVRVRAVLEPSPHGAPDANQAAFAALAAAGADVRWAKRGKGFDHAKSWRVDGDALIVATANLTVSGLERNRELVVRLRDGGAERMWGAVFAADLAGVEDASLAPLLATDSRGTEASETSRLLVAPFGTRAALTSLARTARRRLLVETELFDDPALATELATVARAGARVDVLISADDAIPAVQAAILRAAGVNLLTLRTPYLHAKAMLADETSYAVGSPNMTTSSWDVNREIAWVGSRADVAARLAAVLEADVAAAVPVEQAP
jgi:phosphatidylserine/phosphatidylglycerophosphate/cardiolipin synthase-like enzyme